MGATVAIASFALVVLLHRSLLRGVDGRAELRLRDVAALAGRGELPRTLAGSDEDGTVAQVVAPGPPGPNAVGAHVLAQSQLVRGPLAGFFPPDGAVVVRTLRHVPIPGGSVYRVMAQRIDTPSGPAVVYVAASLEPVTDSIHTLEALLAVVAPSLVLLVGIITWWLVSRTLRPVEAIRSRVAEISASELTRRVPEPGTGDEVQRLAETMNVMLARLETAVARQRSFVSDAAHELRSPLAAIRAELDVASRYPGSTDWESTVDRLGMGTRRMERLVEDLLVLATAEERGLRHRSDVDLDEILMRQLEHLRARSPLTIDVDIDAARVWGDTTQLERVVANLLDNAEQCGPTTVAVRLHVLDEWAQLVIADDGPGVPAEDRLRVFDRFARLDEARSRRDGGAGLGLAIARRILEDHDGSIQLEEADRGTRVVVRLPLTAVSPGDPDDTAARVSHGGE